MSHPGGQASLVAELAGRLAARDASLWPSGNVSADRLGWLDSPREMRLEAAPLGDFALQARLEHPSAVLFGMGGSSLSAVVLRHAFRGALDVLDTTHPQTVDPVLGRARAGALAIVASKSGTTVEPLSLLALWRERVADTRRLLAITDPGTPLDRLATEAGFRAVFRNRPDIGGRYSALSAFGLVPAALAGVDVGPLLDFDETDLRPGVELGLHLAAEQAAGRDKVTLLCSPTVAPFGLWVEQLVAESTGKQGTGLVPVAGESDVGGAGGADAGPGRLGSDRTVVAVSCGAEEAPGAAALEAAGRPVLHQRLGGPADLGELFFRWEVATAIVGSVLGVDPFDEPDVAVAKSATAAALASWPERLPPAGGAAEVVPFLGGALRPGDYVALLAYLPETPETEAALAGCQAALRDLSGHAVTRGYGPRYLHSTGQLHKGGPDTVVAVELVAGPSAGEVAGTADLAVPGQPFTLARLLAAQALGDYEALRSRGRRVLRVDLGADPVGSLEELQRVARR